MKVLIGFHFVTGLVVAFQLDPAKKALSTLSAQRNAAAMKRSNLNDPTRLIQTNQSVDSGEPGAHHHETHRDHRHDGDSIGFRENASSSKEVTAVVNVSGAARRLAKFSAIARSLLPSVIGSIVERGSIVETTYRDASETSWIILLLFLVAIPVVAACLIMVSIDHHASPFHYSTSGYDTDGHTTYHSRLGLKSADHASNVVARPVRVNRSPESSPTFGGGTSDPQYSPKGTSKNRDRLGALAPSPPASLHMEAPLCPDLIVGSPPGILVGVPIDLTPTPEKMVLDIRNLDNDQLVARAFVSEQLEQGIMILSSDGSPSAFLDTQHALADSSPSGQVARHAVIRRALNSEWDTGGGQAQFAMLFLNKAATGSTLVARAGCGRSRGGPLLNARMGPDGTVISITDSKGQMMAVQDPSVQCTSGYSGDTILAGSTPAAQRRSAYRIFYGIDAGLILCTLFAAQKLA